MEEQPQPTPTNVEMTDTSNLRALKVRSIDGSTFEVSIPRDVSIAEGIPSRSIIDNLMALIDLTCRNILDSGERSQESTRREVRCAR